LVTSRRWIRGMGGPLVTLLLPCQLDSTSTNSQY
jgi:hypothetical protein